MDVSQIKKQMLLELKFHPKRINHILSMAKLAKKLAHYYHESKNNALIACYLHDITKYLPFEEAKALIHAYYPLEDITKWVQPALHAMSAAAYAKKIGIENQEIINAVMYHTTARPNMSRFEMIIYISDYCEETRTFDSSHILKEAYVSLERASLMILNETIDYLLQNNQTVMSFSYDAKEEFQKILGGNE